MAIPQNILTERRRLKAERHTILVALADAVVHHAATEPYWRAAAHTSWESLVALDLQIASYDLQLGLFDDSV
jgi:hypothetical protein